MSIFAYISLFFWEKGKREKPDVSNDRWQYREGHDDLHCYKSARNCPISDNDMGGYD